MQKLNEMAVPVNVDQIIITIIAMITMITIMIIIIHNNNKKISTQQEK